MKAKVNKALVLAGGLGTRLRSVIQDIPKPMAPVAGVPFLQKILDFLYNYEIGEVCLSVGYKGEVVRAAFGNHYRGMRIRYAVENEPLGTGGGIRHAAAGMGDDPFFVLNGDTLFHADLWEMERLYDKGADLVMALKPMRDSDRYGSVEWERGGRRVTAFHEKAYRESSLINGGIYLMDKSIFEKYDFPSKFSFEKDLMEAHVKDLKVLGQPSDTYFIDIGIPSDYQRAQVDLAAPTLEGLLGRIKGEGDWTLFLDRDGVINERIPSNYVKKPDEFHFIKGAEKAIADMGKHFKRVVVVTNQQGVGKRLVGRERIARVHKHMELNVTWVGGRFDGIYYCPELARDNPKCRKPNIGMGLWAKADFPDINFSKSVMVGDSISDIRFGKRLGMTTVFVKTKTPEEIELSKQEDVDFVFKNLTEFGELFK